jgi:hypothetical protein
VKTLPLLVTCLALSSASALAETPAVAEAAKPAPAAADSGATAPENAVTYKSDKVTAHVKDMAADAFVAEIAKQAGAKVTGTVETATPVTVDWTAIPLKEALEHVLGTQNFTLTYAEDGALRAIQLRGVQQDGQPVAAATEAPADEEDFKKRPEYKIFKAFDGQGQVPVEGAIAKKLGKSESPWDLLTNTAIGDDDPEVRRTAVEAGMHAFEGNEALRQSVMAPANTMSDAQLAAFARANMYHRAEDFVRNVRRSTTLPDIRERATNVLRELRKIPFTGPKPVEGSGSPRE